MGRVRDVSEVIRTKLSLLAIVLACTLSPTPQARAVTLTPRVHLPIVLNHPPNVGEYTPPVGPVLTPTPVPIGFMMMVTFENRTGGPICYGIEGVKAEEECMAQDGRVYYGSVPMGNYNFWGRGCEGTQVLGNVDLVYRQGTISFACFDFYGAPAIWAKMYEMR